MLPFFLRVSRFWFRPLERVSPVEKYIDPVASGAVSTIGIICAADLAAEAEVVAGLAHLIGDVIRVVPQDIGADTHAWREEVPEIPLSQENRVAVELQQCVVQRSW